jgi:hypothetical protein
MQIQRAASIALEDEYQDPEAHFRSYMTKEEFESNRPLFEQNFYSLKLSTLFGSLTWFQVRILEEAEPLFKDVARKVELDNALLDIANTPNSEFYDDKSWGKIHLKSKALIVKILQTMPNIILFDDMVSDYPIPASAFFKAAGIDISLKAAPILHSKQSTDLAQHSNNN